MSNPQVDRLFDLSGKVALVTGGSRGLGKEMVLAFARRRRDYREPEAAALAKQVESETGRRALPVACHVGNWQQVEALAEKAYQEFGKVDVLVNNAGMSPVYDHISEVSGDLYDKVLDVNLKGPFRLTSVVGTKMAEGDGGSIINISSTGAINPRAGIIPYAGAKAALNAMTVGFADAFAPKVRVNCIMPGPFLTDISKAWDMEEFNERAKTTIKLQRGGQPEEIVGAALYFASSASSYTTGSILTVAGGADH